MNKIKVLCFTADFCGPCKVMKPVMTQIASENSDKFDISYIDIEENAELASQYGIRGVPTYVVVKDNKEVDRIVGATTKDKILVKLNLHV